MSTTIYFAKYAKKRNSTYQATFNTSFDVVLKAPTSIDNPTVTLEADTFDYNLAKWGDNYYFVDRVVSVKNRIWEVTLIIDALATVKADILASTQYVCYSSYLSSSWLVDSRLVSSVHSNAVNVSGNLNIFSTVGTYVLSVNGKSGCELFIMSESKIRSLLANISQWRSDAESEFLNGLTTPGGDIVVATENLYTVLARSGAFSNAYSEAPNCIRSCIWVPFDNSIFNVVDANKEIYLGQFATGVRADAISSEPYTDFITLDIPWHYSDWRRAANEQLYLYLPLVGNVELKSHNLTHRSSITIAYSVTASDGCIAYEVTSGNEILGTYGASCCANYPIGISQQASAGDIANAIISGMEKSISMGVNSSISPFSASSAAAGVAFESVVSAYNVEKTMYSNNNTTVGGIGGGAGSGLDLYAVLQDVYFETIDSPSNLAATMGYPTMKTMQLSSLTGYCQCANAHIESSVHASVLDAVDAYMNSGFYIE